jgi:hypothetical protein
MQASSSQKAVTVSVAFLISLVWFIVFVQFFFGLIAVDGDTLNPTLGYLQQQNAFFRIFFQIMRKPAKSLGKCGVS